MFHPQPFHFSGKSFPLPVVKQDDFLHLPDTLGQNVKQHDIAGALFVFRRFLIRTGQADEEAADAAQTNEAHNAGNDDAIIKIVRETVEIRVLSPTLSIIIKTSIVRMHSRRFSFNNRLKSHEV
ncbi:MAG: hypothetical protein H7X86_05170 [Gorillibacterium sp.]|nr:hypothetical protein [Gorillibacterium sp.]